MKRIIVGVSGASGMPLALCLLRHLAALPDVESHLILSPGAHAVLEAECGLAPSALHAMADVSHDAACLGAAPASGSWQHDGMVVCPCSMSSLASIATGAGTNLLHRAADVTLKERRPLILVPRESPLSRIHLRNMLWASEAGAVIMPFMPAFYSGEDALEGLMGQFCGRIFDQLGLSHQLCRRWQGPSDERS